MLTYVEICCLVSQLELTERRIGHPEVLTIITGKNLRGGMLRNGGGERRHDHDLDDEVVDVDSSSTTEYGRFSSNQGGDDSPSAFRISAEIQQCLVEDFYPPISSFTAAGNPGRVLISLSDLK